MRKPTSSLHLRRALFIALSLLPWVAAYVLGTFVSGLTYRLPTPLMDAVRQNRSEDLNALLAQGVDVHEKAHNGFTALWVAVDTGNVTLAKRLIDAGANVNERYDTGEPILMRALSRANRPGRSTEMVELLLAHGADVHARTLWHGHPVLRYAHTLALVRVLIQAGADVNASDCGGNVPLGLALKWDRDPPMGDVAIIRMLLEAGARPPQHAVDGLRTLAACDPRIGVLLSRAPAIAPEPYRDGPCYPAVRQPAEHTKALKAWGDRHGIVLSHKWWEVIRALPLSPVLLWAPAGVLLLLAWASRDTALANWSAWFLLFLIAGSFLALIVALVFLPS